MKQWKWPQNNSNIYQRWNNCGEEQCSSGWTASECKDSMAWLECVAMSFSSGPSQPRDRTLVSCIAGRHLILWATREAPRREGGGSNSTGFFSFWGAQQLSNNFNKRNTSWSQRNTIDAIPNKHTSWGLSTSLHIFPGFPCVSDSKESTCNAGDQVLQDWEDPLEKERATHSSILPGEFHGQRSLAGYSPWASKESNTTEWPALSQHSHTTNRWE